MSAFEKIGTLGEWLRVTLYGKDSSGNPVAQGMDGDAANVSVRSPTNLYIAGKPLAANTTNSAQMLWNPAGSGKDLVIEDAIIQTTVDGEIYIIRGTAVLATEITTDIGALDSDAPATVAELYHADDDGIPTGVRLATGYAENLAPRTLSEVIGMVLHPGEGCCIYYLGLLGKLRVIFNYTERDV